MRFISGIFCACSLAAFLHDVEKMKRFKKVFATIDIHLGLFYN